MKLRSFKISVDTNLSLTDKTIGHAKPRMFRGVSTDFAVLAYDLLALGDVCAIGLSGCLSALLWIRLSITTVLPGHLWTVFGSRATVAAFIAPFVLRAVRVRARDVRYGGNQRWNAHELSSRFVIFAVLMLMIGYAGGALKDAPGGWLVLWAVLGWCGVIANRLALAKGLDFLERRGSLHDVVA